jgi:hypothetical protein
MAEFVPGVELARAFYQEVVAPRLGGVRHSAARLGPGSDVLGYDTARSTDHDWGRGCPCWSRRTGPSRWPASRPSSAAGRPRSSWPGSAGS